MFRVLENPTFDFATGKLLSHDGESFVETFPVKFDRDIQGKAKKNAGTAGDVGTGYGSTASQIGSSLIPGLESEATHPTGYDPTTKNEMLVQNQEALGGASSGVTGEANLAAARTRNAGGFGRVLDEAARIKGRQLATGAQNVENESARLAQEKQMQAQKMLAGLYGTDTSRQLEAMGLENQDLNTALNAGKTGWLQNTEGVIDTLAGAAKAYKP